MNNSMVTLSSNWTQIGGCPFSQAFQVFTADPDYFKRPDLDDIVDEEKSILLSKSDSSDYCELLIGVLPQYKVQSLSLVCNVSKIEIFFGPIKEYLETVHGTYVDEMDDEFRTYRYDIELKRSGVIDLTLKFLTRSTDVCIFGIMLYIAPNPNGITTLLPNSNYFKTDTRGTQDPSKVEQLLELMKTTKLFSKSLNSSTNTTMNDHANISEEELLSNQLANDIVINHLKSFIDERLKQMEERLLCRLEKMENRQQRIIDDILTRLERLK